MSNITILATPVQEEGTAGIVVSFRDDTGALVIPDSATWTLSDLDSNVINSRLAVPITPMASSVTIALSGEDLSIGAFGVDRELLVEAIYDSSLGNNLPMKQAVQFKIQGFVKVT